MKPGATHAEWDNFYLMGLLEDLLPVVSNPQAKISPESKMQAVGKTPSVYNKAGFVAGLPKWTEKRATEREFRRWRDVDDYGICIQTRRLRAIDVDVDARDKALKYFTFINDRAPGALPVRTRNNSGKLLMAFYMPGAFAKRVIRVDGGIIEFLADGQQFVAAGTHTSGARYEWSWNGHHDFPTLTPEEFERIWS